MLLLLAAAAPAPSAATKFVVGDKQNWAPNVNYTSWPDKYHFYVNDWLRTLISPHPTRSLLPTFYHNNGRLLDRPD